MEAWSISVCTLFVLAFEGVLDAATQRKMNQPRCGVPDIGEYATTKTTWQYTNLRYRIDSYPTNLARTTIRQEIQLAWQVKILRSDSASILFISTPSGFVTNTWDAIKLIESDVENVNNNKNSIGLQFPPNLLLHLLENLIKISQAVQKL